MTESTSSNTTTTGSKMNTEALKQAIWNSYQPAYRTILRKTGSRDLAHDIAADGCIKAIEKINQYDATRGSKVSSWVTQISIRNWLDHVRSHAVSRTSSTGDSQYLENVGGSYEMDHGVDWSEVTAAVNNLLSSLPEKHKEPLRLFYFEGLKYKQIAAVMNTSIGTIMSRINCAKSKLANMQAAKDLLDEIK